MVEEGERRQWPEVVRSGLYGLLRHAAEGGSEADEEVRRLLERASADGDDDMVALALAWRAWVAIVKRGEMGGQADEDLARAAVMLEGAGGDPVVRTAAHFRVGFSFWHRRLWELADEQFAACEAMVDAVDPFSKDPFLHRAALALDRVMVQVDLALVQRELGDLDSVRRRRRVQAELIATCEGLDMPSAWREHISIAALVVDVLAGRQRLKDVEEAISRLEGNENLAEWEAHLYLAKALCTPELGPATALAEHAVEVLQRGGSQDPVYFMALRQTVELEARVAGKKTAGLRLAEAVALEREHSRLASLAGMRATLASERMRAERETLLRHAYSDPLTGLANRRGFERHVEQLIAAGVKEGALLLFDLDDLKPLNDRFGHSAGDFVLCRLADVLTASVRLGDFAARIGGDEFVLLLAGADFEAAAKRSEEVAHKVAALSWDEVEPRLEVSVSAGVSAGPLSQIVSLTREADTALYRAKSARRSGRRDPGARSAPGQGWGRQAAGS
jgi:diguanylate cyclase (GGDEF)-like protein